MSAETLTYREPVKGKMECGTWCQIGNVHVECVDLEVLFWLPGSDLDQEPDFRLPPWSKFVRLLFAAGRGKLPVPC